MGFHGKKITESTEKNGKENTKNMERKEICYLYNMIGDYDTIEKLKEYKEDTELQKLVRIWEESNLNEEEFETPVYYDKREKVCDYLIENYGFYWEDTELKF